MIKVHIEYSDVNTSELVYYLIEALIYTMKNYKVKNKRRETYEDEAVVDIEGDVKNEEVFDGIVETLKKIDNVKVKIDE